MDSAIKKLLVLTLLASPSWGAIAFVQGKWCSSGAPTHTSDACVFTSNVTAASLIVVGCGGNRQTGVNYTVTDNAGDTFTLINSTTVNNNGSGAAGVWYAKNAVGGATTVTCQDANSLATWIQQIVSEYSGAATATDPFDVSSSSAPVASTSVTQMVTNSATTTGSNELMYAYCLFGLNTITSQSGTLRLDSVDNAFMESEDATLATPQSYQSTFNATANNQQFACIQAAFKLPGVTAQTNTLIIK